MSMLGSLMQKVILKRTGFTALIRGQVIVGCGECIYNHEEPGIMKGAGIHRCSMVLGLDSKNRPIWDPGNIPEWCPYKVIEVKPE